MSTISFNPDIINQGKSNLGQNSAVASVAGRTGTIVLTVSDISGAVPTSQLGAASGVATLDSSQHLTLSQLPPSIVGGIVYQGTWNATSNTPTLVSGVGTKGFCYKVAVAGSTNLDGITQWNVGDLAIYDGTAWDKVDGLANEVVSVFSRTGTIVAQTGDYTVAQVTGAAPLASPALTGVPTAPTPSTADNSTTLATTAYVQNQAYATLASPTLTGTPAAPTPSTSDNTTKIATTAFVKAQAYAPLASPALTGTPTAPTASNGTNNTQIATTAFVMSQVATGGIVASVFSRTGAVVATSGDYTVSQITGAAPTASPTFTGTVTLPAGSTSVQPMKFQAGAKLTTPVAHSFEWDGTALYATDSGASRHTVAYLDSPTLTGTPASTTAAVDTNTTQIATTAFVLAQAANTAPVMDGTQTLGTSTRYARQDHVHASDTSRAPLASPTFTGVPAAPTAAVDTNTTQVATTAYVVGQGYAKLASPTLTGVPAAPTAAVDTNTTQVATTAFVLAQAANTAPVMDGTQTLGTSTRYARQDHVHASDTSRSPVNNPTFTGTVTLPAGSTSVQPMKFQAGAKLTTPVAHSFEWDGTSVYATDSGATRHTLAYLDSPTFTGTPASTTAAVDTNTTQIATTAYVIGQSYLKSATASSTYAPIASPTLTGTPLSTTAAVDTNTTQIATTAYVIGQGYLKSATASSTYAPIASPTLTGTVTLPAGSTSVQPLKFQAGAKLTTPVAHSFEWDGTSLYATDSGATRHTLAYLDSPTFTGTPSAPTATGGTNTTQLATTAFVQAAVGAGGIVGSVFSRTGAVVATAGDYTAAQIYYNPGGTGSTSSGITNTSIGTEFYPEQYGAAANGSTDDTTAINNAAAAAAAAGGTLVFNDGKTYKITANVTFKCHVKGYGATILTPNDYNATAVTIGDTSNYLLSKIMWLPMILTSKTTTPGWANTSSIGLIINNIQNCEIHVAGVQYFTLGLWLASTSKGSSYNSIFLGKFLNNKVQVKLRPTDSTGWVNENDFYGGECTWNSGEGTNVPFTRGVLLESFSTAAATTTGAQSLSVTSGTFTISRASGSFVTDGFYNGCTITCSGFANAGNNKTFLVKTVAALSLTLANNTAGLVTEGPTASVTITTDGATFGNVVNNNTFHRFDFEGTIPEAFLECRGASYNNFFGCRWETSGSANVFMTGLDATRVAKFNNIIGGYINGGGDLVFTTNTNGGSNTVMISNRLAHMGGGSYGWMNIANSSSDNNASLSIWGNAVGEAGLIAPSGTTWGVQLGMLNCDFKASADANPRLRIKPNNGQLQLGDGSGTPVSYIAGSGLNNILINPRGLPAMNLTAPVSGVNYLTVTGTVTGSAPILAVDGDTNLSLAINAKGTGTINFGSALSLAANLGMTIATGAPGTTTNSLYQVSGSLYFNGTQLAAAGNISRNAQSGSYTILGTDQLVSYTGTGGNTFTMPAASTSGKQIIIKHSGSGILTVIRGGTDTIDGSVYGTQLSQYQSLTLVSNGTSNWESI